jgi:putative ABC transport system substrate-binding protein
MNRCAFISLLGGAAVSLACWPMTALAQTPDMPVIAFMNGGSAEGSARNGAAFKKGLSEVGLIEGRNVAIEFHWLEGRYDQVPGLLADLIRRRVNVIASPGFPPGALAAKAATTTIPIVFGVGDDPVRLGLVASLARPGGNVTGINFFVHEIVSKRLALLNELVPRARRIAVLVNPGNAAAAETTIREAQAAAGKLGLQILSFNAANSEQIDAAFAAIAQERADAVLIGGDGFFHTRRGQMAALAMQYRLPSITAQREFAEAGGLMTYGTLLVDMFRQAGIYAGTIVKGTKPSDLPVLQSTKFELVINLKTATAFGIDVSPTLLARADEVIE